MLRLVFGFESGFDNLGATFSNGFLGYYGVIIFGVVIEFVFEFTFPKPVISTTGFWG